MSGFENTWGSGAVVQPFAHVVRNVPWVQCFSSSKYVNAKKDKLNYSTNSLTKKADTFEAYICEEICVVALLELHLSFHTF